MVWVICTVSIKIMGSATQALRADLDSSFFWLLHFLPAPKSLIFFVFQAYKSRGPSGGQGTAYFILPKSLPESLPELLPKSWPKKIYQNSYRSFVSSSDIKIWKFNLLFGSCFVNLIAMIKILTKILTKTPYQNP